MQRRKVRGCYNFGYRVFISDLLGEGLYFHAKAQRRKVRGCLQFWLSGFTGDLLGEGLYFHAKAQRRKVRGCYNFGYRVFISDLLGEGLYFHAKAQRRKGAKLGVVCNFGYRVLPVIYWGWHVIKIIFTQRRKVRGCLQFCLFRFLLTNH